MAADPEVLAVLREIREDVRDTRKEQTDGFKAVRSELASHARDDAEGFRNVRDDIRAVDKKASENAERVAKLEGRDEGEDRFAGNTGRFNVPPMSRVPTGHDWAVPTPAGAWPPPPSVPTIPTKRESGFWSSFWHKLKKWAGHGAVGVVVLLGTEGTHWLAGKGCQPAQVAQAASEKPATTTPPIVPLPFQESPTHDLPSVRTDAGVVRP